MSDPNIEMDKFTELNAKRKQLRELKLLLDRYKDYPFDKQVPDGIAFHLLICDLHDILNEHYPIGD